MVGLVLLAMLGLLGVSPVAADDVEAACVQPPPRGQAEPLTLASSVAPGMVETRIHWTQWSQRLVYGRDAVLAGQVVTDDGALARATVELYARPAGQSEWSHLSTRSSDPENGVFTFTCLDVPRSTDFRVVYEGTVLFAGSSAVRRVPVARAVESMLRHRTDGQFSFAGSVAPRYVERRVVLERKSCGRCTWERLRTVATDDRSRWRFGVSAPHQGVRYFRVAVPGDTAFVTGHSKVWRIGR